MMIFKSTLQGAKVSCRIGYMATLAPGCKAMNDVSTVSPFPHHECLLSDEVRRKKIRESISDDRGKAQSIGEGISTHEILKNLIFK